MCNLLAQCSFNRLMKTFNYKIVTGMQSYRLFKQQKPDTVIRHKYSFLSKYGNGIDLIYPN